MNFEYISDHVLFAILSGLGASAAVLLTIIYVLELQCKSF